MSNYEWTCDTCLERFFDVSEGGDCIECTLKEVDKLSAEDLVSYGWNNFDEPMFTDEENEKVFKIYVETCIVKKTPEKELPLLIGALKTEEGIEKLEERLRKVA